MAESSRTDESPLDAFLEAVWRDAEAGEIRPLEEYLRAFPGDALGMAREYIRIVEERAGRTPGEFRVATDAARIGSYRIVSELGRGGQAVVYLAEDLKLRRRVALKVINVGPLAGENALDRFRREAEVSARLDHPGICPVFEIGSEGGLAWIAMRYVEGETLARRITTAREKSGAGRATVVMLDEVPTSGSAADLEVEDGRKSAAKPPARPEILRVVALVEQAARALHAAHEAGVLHRDIKPGNIMVSASGTPVILDFGLARDLTVDAVSLTRTGDLMGTPHYMSPEQLTRRTIRLDRRTDIYSLGVTLYECLTLLRPFDEPSRDALYHAILTKPPPPPRKANPAIPRDLEVVIETALAKDRDLRYQTALALAEDLGRVLRGEPVLARRPGPVLRAWRWARRRRALVGTVLLALALGYAGGIQLIGRTDRRNTSDAPSRGAVSAPAATEAQNALLPVPLTSVALSTPSFEEAAREEAHRIQSDVRERVGPDVRLVGFVARPWVLLVEEDEGWDEERVGQSRLESLAALEDTILQDLGVMIGLKPVTAPRPVLFFRNHARFQNYSGAPTVVGHFEATTGRFVLHDDCDEATLRHEATHCLIQHWRTAALDPLQRSLWFEEGIAEWYSGARRRLVAGRWEPDFSAIRPDRLRDLVQATRHSREDLFTLPELLSVRFASPELRANPRRYALAYSQSWFLVYFLNRFNIDDAGIVRPDRPGKHRADWHSYVREELKGRSGRDVFQQVTALDDGALAELEQNYWQFLAYVERKVRLRQTDVLERLAPWEDARNRRSEHTGEVSDDFLPPFDPERAPERK